MDILSATQLKQKGEYRLVYKLHPFEIDEDDPVDFVAVTKNNSLIEFHSGRQTAECPFDFRISSKCSDLSLFQSYNPTYRHYLFINGNSLVVVVKRGDQLTVRDTIQGVAKYSIVDRYGLGKPQVEVRMTDGEIEVFDFSEKLFASRDSENRLEGGVKLKVLSQIQMLRTTVKSAEELLQEKTRLMNKLTKSVLMNSSNLYDDVEIEERNIPVIGSPIITPKKSNGSVLEVGSSWVRILDNQWVIGFQVMNSQTIPLTHFQLFALDKSVAVKESLLFCKPSRQQNDKVEYYSPRDCLNEYQSGFIVGVLNEPPFIQPTVKFHCMTICRSAEEHQTYLGEIVISVDDITKLSLFEPDVSFTDLISIQATYKQLNLNLESDDSSESQRFLFESLMDSHKFLPINDSVLICNKNKDSSLGSLMIVKNLSSQPSNYCFIYRELNQLLILLHHLKKANLCKKITPKPGGSDPSSWLVAKNALKDELVYVQNVLLNDLTEDNSEEGEIEYSVDRLLNSQMRTAKEITSLL